MKTVLYNGKVYVKREQFAEAILIEDGIIKMVGSNEKIFNSSLGKCEQIDCKGKTIIPGLNDSHLHLIMFADTLTQVNINNCASIDELITRCKEFISRNPDRVKNGIHSIGWNQDLFVDDKRNPNRFDLDKISTEIPIILERVCGHVLVTNTKAIEILGIDGNSPQWEGGAFEIGDDNYPTGLFAENACSYVRSIIPDTTIEQREDMIIKGMEYAVAHGLTSIQSNDIGTSVADMDAYFELFRKIYKQEKALLRYRHQICFSSLDEFKNYIVQGEFSKKLYTDDSWLTLGPLKLFKDGSLGARTALMNEEYNDDKGNFGIECITDNEMQEYCNLASKANMQVITHAIGDKAIEKTIDCYEKTFGNNKNTLRHAIVHCQITDNSLLERIAQLGILVMYQPIFLDYDMQIVEDRCGKEKASTSYAFKTLQKLGGHISYGTDCPVESCNPFLNIYSAVTRKNLKENPEAGFYPNECVDIYTAIDAYTEGSAYAEFMEDKKGRIKEGYYADVVMLDKDIFSIDSTDIKTIQPVMTMVGGKIVYKRNIK